MLKLKNINFYNLDYKDFLNELLKQGLFLDNKSYLIYLDPPFLGNPNSDRYDKQSYNPDELYSYLNLFNKKNICWVLSCQAKDLKSIFKKNEMTLKMFTIEKKEASNNIHSEKVNTNKEYIIWKQFG
jgi:site-specific DNA-adenine methylase